MKAFLVMISLFLSVAQAGDRTAAYNAICKPMTFESQRANCLIRVKHYAYFDNLGLGFCAGLSFDSNKLSCLDIIGDKVYEGYEMDICLNQTFESKKLECLMKSGSPYDPTRPACVPREEVISELKSSQDNLRNGHLKQADQAISNLLSRFTDCI